MRALIDGDILVYRCAFAAEHTVRTALDPASGVVLAQYESAAEMKDWCKDRDEESYEIELTKRIEPLSHALANVRSVVTGIEQTLQPDKLQVYLSEGQCFRHYLATMKKYKGNRDDAPRPMYYNEVRTYLQERYGATICRSIEADDMLAMEQRNDSIIVSIDKDLLQVPGWHYNWVTGEAREICREHGEFLYWQQVLTGDGTDNIPGIHGCGPKTAAKILRDQPSSDFWSIALQKWDEYLCSDKPKPVKDMISIEDKWHYTSWDERAIEKDTEQIVTEVMDLIEVGGDNAEEAWCEEGQGVPWAEGEEGEGAKAAGAV